MNEQLTDTLMNVQATAADSLAQVSEVADTSAIMRAMYELDKLDVHMGGGAGMLALNIVLAIVMFGVALGIKPKTFVDILKNPRSSIIGIVCQLILLPGLTFLLTIACKSILSPMVALGMILVASCPGGNISNFITSLSRGNTELSVSLTALNTAVCEKKGLEIPELHIPLGDIFTTIFVILGIPLVLGILCSHYLPKLTAALKKPMSYLSIVFFIGMVCIAFAGNFDVFIKCILAIFLVVLVHNLLALGIGFGTGTLLKVPYKDRRTITIETGIQNSGLGLALLLNPKIFDPVMWENNGGMLVITAWWGVWHIISGLTLAMIWRANGRKEQITE